MTDHPMRTDDFMERALADHGSAVLRLAMDQLRNLADAQDATQEVFLRLLKSDTPFEGAEHLRAWLLRVTVNRCRELHRALWRRRVDALDEQAELRLPSPSAGTEDAALAELRADPVWQALRRLPAKLRVVALLHYVEEYDTAQIARIVGSPPATVRTRLHRARKQMRQILEPEGDAS